jgi:hypothetical protein
MNAPNDTYQKLDRAALWLVAGEFGLAAILLLLTILMIIGNLISYDAFDLDYSAGEIITLVLALVYGLAYLGNLAIGVMGLYLYATEKREGYPGTGHLLNWILLSATLVLLLALIAAVISSL